MCGIVGGVGERNVVAVILEGEGWIDEALEWRRLIKAAAMRDMELPEDGHPV